MDDHARLYEYLKSRPTPGKEPVPAAPRPKKTKPGVSAPDGFEQLGEFTFRRTRREPHPLASRGEEVLLSARVPARDLVFFDTETTGLSGGAGNLAFLLGTGYGDGLDLVTEQYFLSDFPGEEEFLKLIAPLFSPDRTFVSYNGSSFDSHLLVSRFRLNRLELTFPRQYDLLHPSRRLWKRSVGALLGSCSLKNIERAVLNVERGEDIDGAQVPEYYFDYLRTGDTRALAPVFYHNRVDVHSLVLLLAKIELLLRDPGNAHAEESVFPPDAAALGVMLHGIDRNRAVTYLEGRWQAGDTSCGRVLGYYYKRARAYDKAGRIWESLFNLPDNLEPGIELAIHLEHRARDVGRALEVVRLLLKKTDNLNDRVRDALEKRRLRLVDKMERKKRKDCL
jgi:uncharacterized protein YprB with RNaseH-like and TPR domain